MTDLVITDGLQEAQMQRLHIQRLEERLEKLEGIVKQQVPNLNLEQVLGPRPQYPRAQPLPSLPTQQPTVYTGPESHRYDYIAPKPTQAANFNHETDGNPVYDDGSSKGVYSDGILGPFDIYHGRTQGFFLVQEILDVKNAAPASTSNIGPPTANWIPPNRRQEFWVPSPWESLMQGRSVTVRFPPLDLIPILVDNYFSHMNLIYPLLHRPSFERALERKAYLTDVSFASVVLLVCALGSRFCEDTRVNLEGQNRHSAGWKWFEQAISIKKMFTNPPALCDVQACALAAMYAFFTSSPQSSWTLVGIGLRLVQDVGAHRKSNYYGPPTVESELWKRAFWVLVSIERKSCAILSRASIIHHEDFDMEFPLEVDDEYWEHVDPNKAFKQPPGVPSMIAYFTSSLKLTGILGLALRTIYSINKSKVLLSLVGPNWEQNVVTDLDSKLNAWHDSIPDHLRWDPQRANFVHLQQSATLYVTYYYVQILVHRPFIQSPQKSSPLSFPSLAICTSAARSCCHVAEQQRKRGLSALPHTVVPVFIAGIVLLLNIWAARKSGIKADLTTQHADVSKCLEILKADEERRQVSGRLWDILSELVSLGKFSIPAPLPTSAKKREREEATTETAGNLPRNLKSTKSKTTRSASGHKTTSGSSRSPPPYTFQPVVHPVQPVQQPVELQQYQRASEESDPAPFGQYYIPQNWQPQQSSPQTAYAESTTAYGIPTPQVSATSSPLGEGYSAQEFPSSNFAAPPNLIECVNTMTIGDTTFDFNPEALQMWANVPMNFDTEDWGSYLNGIPGSEMESFWSSGGSPTNL